MSVGVLRGSSVRWPVPGLAEGTQLLGEYKDTGFVEPVWIARRADGQVVQLPRLLQLICEEINGKCDAAQIATRVTARLGRTVTADNVVYLVDSKLRPAGLAGLPGKPPVLARQADPLLALHFRRAIIPARVVHFVRVFAPLFTPWVVAAILSCLVAVDVWLFVGQHVDHAVEEVLQQPALMFFVLALVIAATAFHEVGHAAGCRYGGARPGAIGVGLYLMWPVFYTDITDTYRLDRRGRLRADLGGLYFNAIFLLGAGIAYALTRFEPLFVFVVVQHVLALQQLIPLPRLDGYYVLSDLTGLPDVLSRLKPLIASLVRPRSPHPRVRDLKGRVRAVVTVYVAALIPALLGVCTLLALNLQQLVRQGRRSFDLHFAIAERAWAAGDAATAGMAALHLIALLIPALGLALMLTHAARPLVVLVYRWSARVAGRSKRNRRARGSNVRLNA